MDKAGEIVFPSCRFESCRGYQLWKGKPVEGFHTFLRKDAQHDEICQPANAALQRSEGSTL